MQKVDLAELRRLHDAATKGVFWQEEVAFSEACKVHLPDLLDELEAAREEVDRLRSVVTDPTYREALALLAGKDARDRRQKLIGAAEWLKEFAGDADGSIHITHAWLRERAAKLRQEAGQ